MVVDTSRPYGYEALLQDARALERQYGGLIAVGEYGTSQEGRSLLQMRLGEGRACALMLGAHHGREYITSAYLMRMCECYAALAAKRDALMQRLLSEKSLLILPMVNPDGVEISIHGISPRQAAMPLRHGAAACWKANARGVDLNRNYPCLFTQKAGQVRLPASEGYSGECAASEKEVRAVMAFCEGRCVPLAVTLHAKGEEIFYADSNTPALIEKSREIAKRLGRLTGYALAPVSRDPRSFAAGFENWFREKYQKPCLLLEISPYDGPHPHNMAAFDALVWEKLKWLGRELLML